MRRVAVALFLACLSPFPLSGQARDEQLVMGAVAYSDGWREALEQLSSYLNTPSLPDARIQDTALLSYRSAVDLLDRGELDLAILPPTAYIVAASLTDDLYPIALLRLAEDDAGSSSDDGERISYLARILYNPSRVDFTHSGPPGERGNLRLKDGGRARMAVLPLSTSGYLYPKRLVQDYLAEQRTAIPDLNHHFQLVDRASHAAALDEFFGKPLGKAAPENRPGRVDLAASYDRAISRYIDNEENAVHIRAWLSANGISETGESLYETIERCCIWDDREKMTIPAGDVLVMRGGTDALREALQRRLEELDDAMAAGTPGGRVPESLREALAYVQVAGFLVERDRQAAHNKYAEVSDIYEGYSVGWDGYPDVRLQTGGEALSADNVVESIADDVRLWRRYDPDYEPRIAVVLSGGGAGGAYQAGVLEEITAAFQRYWDENGTQDPQFNSLIRVGLITGTSAGAVNAIAGAVSREEGLQPGSVWLEITGEDLLQTSATNWRYLVFEWLRINPFFRFLFLLVVIAIPVAGTLAFTRWLARRIVDKLRVRLRVSAAIVISFLGTVWAAFGTLNLISLLLLGSYLCVETLKVRRLKERRGEIERPGRVLFSDSLVVWLFLLLFFLPLAYLAWYRSATVSRVLWAVLIVSFGSLLGLWEIRLKQWIDSHPDWQRTWSRPGQGGTPIPFRSILAIIVVTVLLLVPFELIELAVTKSAFFERIRLADVLVEKYAGIVDMPVAGPGEEVRGPLGEELVRQALDNEIDVVITATDFTRRNGTIHPRDVYFYLSKAEANDDTPGRQFSNAESVYDRNLPLWVPIHQNERKLVDMVVASAALFPLFPPVEVTDLNGPGIIEDRHTFVDGGFIHNVPVEAALSMDATHMIIVKVQATDQPTMGGMINPDETCSDEDQPEMAGTRADEDAPLWENLRDVAALLFERAQLTDLHATREIPVYEIAPEKRVLGTTDFSGVMLCDGTRYTMAHFVEQGRSDSLGRFRQVSLGRPHFMN